MRTLAVVLLVSIFGSSVAAQSVDQRRLADCVAESQEIITDAVIWKERLEAAGTSVSAYTYANNKAEGYRETLLKDVQTMLAAGENQSVISKELEKDYEKMHFRIGLVTDMLNEAFDSTNHKHNRVTQISS
jgi:hypothetical protein